MHRGFNSNDSRPLPSYTIFFGQRNTQGAQISLLRSLRVPEDGREYELPLGLGTLPIYSVGSLSEVLLVSMVAQGGLILPIHGM